MRLLSYLSHGASGAINPANIVVVIIGIINSYIISLNV